MSALLTRGCLSKWQDERRSSAHTSNLILLSTTDSSSPFRSLSSPTLQAELPSSIASFTLFCSFSRRPVDYRYVAAGPADLLRRRPWAVHTPLERHCKPSEDQQQTSAAIYRRKRSLPYARRLLFVCGPWWLRQLSTANLAADSRPWHILHIPGHSRAQRCGFITMSNDGLDKKPGAVDTALGDMKLESPDAASDTIKVNGSSEHSLAPTATKTSRSPSLERSHSLSSATQTPISGVYEHEEILGGEVALKLEPGKPPKLSRKSSQKVMSRPPQLFDHLPNSTSEAITTFQVIRDCIYGSKYMGSSEHDALGCDCSEEWSKF